MLYFLLYNDDSHTEHLLRLIKSIKEHGKEFQVILFNKSKIDQEFNQKYRSILDCKRGGGYWLWKPYIIYNTMKKLKDNDILFYMDSKYFFIDDFKSLYIDYMKHHDLLVWKNKPNDPVFLMKQWCKMDVIRKYNMYEKVFNENAEDCWGGALIIKKNKKTMHIMHEWLEMCCQYENITDSPSKLNNDSLFVEHRHDQSLLSILLHKYNIEMQFFEKKTLQNIRAPF